MVGAVPTGLTVQAPFIGIVSLLNTATIVPAEKNEAGLVTIDWVSDEQTGPFAAQLKQTVTFDRIFNALMTAPQLGDFKIVAEGFTPKRSLVTFTPPGSTDSDDAREFREAAKAHQSYLMQIAIVPFLNAPSSTLGDMTKTKSAVLLSLNPEMTIKTRVQKSLGITGGAETGGDPLEPILDAPDFPQPMYETLRDLSEDFLFFGLEHVPLNTVMLLKTNPKFVESFLVGLNAEMSHELLWRNYPTDQRGATYRAMLRDGCGELRETTAPANSSGSNVERSELAASGENRRGVEGAVARLDPNSAAGYSQGGMGHELRASSLHHAATPCAHRHSRKRNDFEGLVSTHGYFQSRHSKPPEHGRSRDTALNRSCPADRVVPRAIGDEVLSAGRRQFRAARARPR
jgi:hypothetical protein